MARRIPSSEGNPWAHPALTLSLLVAWIAASMAVLTALCASCHRKAKPPSSPSNNSKAETSAPTATTSVEIEEEEQQHDQEEEEDDEKITELGTAIHGPINPTVLPASTSKRKLSMSVSLSIPEGLTKIKTRKERHRKGGEESLWKKTIILGEKCRLPNDEGEEGEQEGNQEKSYRSRTPRSLPASRNSSFTNAEAVPPP